MDLGLRDRTVLVTDGSRGLGLAIARILHQEGARVVIFSPSPRELVAAAKAVGEIVAVPADVRRAADRRRVIKTAGSLDGLVISFEESDSGTVPGVLELVRAARPSLRRRSGRIVTVVEQGRTAAAPGAARLYRFLDVIRLAASFVHVGGPGGAGVKDDQVARLVAFLVSSRASWRVLPAEAGRHGVKGSIP